MKVLEKDLKKLAYELYKMHWTREHISKEWQLAEYRGYYLTNLEDNDDNYTFEDHLEENGYDGELYVCFDEFIDEEYEDADYMSYLLGNSVFWKAYKEYMGV